MQKSTTLLFALMVLFTAADSLYAQQVDPGMWIRKKKKEQLCSRKK